MQLRTKVQKDSGHLLSDSQFHFDQQSTARKDLVMAPIQQRLMSHSLIHYTLPTGFWHNYSVLYYCRIVVCQFYLHMKSNSTNLPHRIHIILQVLPHVDDVYYPCSYCMDQMHENLLLHIQQNVWLLDFDILNYTKEGKTRILTK
jgi:hypothetical protein